MGQREERGTPVAAGQAGGAAAGTGAGPQAAARPGGGPAAARATGGPAAGGDGGSRAWGRLDAGESGPAGSGGTLPAERPVVPSYARAATLEQVLQALARWEGEGAARPAGPGGQGGQVAPAWEEAGPGAPGRDREPRPVPLRVLAGGTDLLTLIRDGRVAPRRLLDITRVEGLAGVERRPDGGWRLGALVTLAELARPGVLPGPYRALAEAAGASATPALRNRATLGGNLEQQVRCWYYRSGLPCLLAGAGHCACTGPDAANAYHAVFGHEPSGPGGGCGAVHPSDPAVALVALGAEVVLARWTPNGVAYRQVPAEDYFTGLRRVGPAGGHDGADEASAAGVPRITARRPGELITEVRLPGLPGRSTSLYRKLTDRRAWQFALVSLAVWVDWEDAGAGGPGAAPAGGAPRRIRDLRLVLGGVAIKPWRLHAVEERLRGRPLDREAVGEAAALAVAGARPLEGSRYKVELVQGLVARTLADLAGGRAAAER